MHENMKANNENKKKELARQYEEQYGLKENIAEGIIERYGKELAIKRLQCMR